MGQTALFSIQYPASSIQYQPSHLLQRTKPRNEFRRFHFYQIRFHMFDDSVADSGRQKIDNRPVNFGRRGKRPAFLSIGGDRKSTRLNSSHSSISYAVFCLKKKTT